MARPECTPHRDRWWEERMKNAQTPKAKVTVSMNKILADLSRLPEEQQNPAREMVAMLLGGVIEEVEIKVAEEAWA